jgi:hypothetical protein
MRHYVGLKCRWYRVQCIYDSRDWRVDQQACMNTKDARLIWRSARCRIRCQLQIWHLNFTKHDSNSQATQ